MQIVTFTEKEMRALKALAEGRNQNKEDNNVQTRKVDDESSDTEVHEVGIMGEAACAKYLGEDVSVSREIMPSGDDGHDITVEELTVEVKTREGKEKDFAMYDNSSDIDADMAILCWKTDRNKITVVGWLPKTEWVLKAHSIRFGKWTRRGVEWDEMRPISELKELLNAPVAQSG